MLSAVEAGDNKARVGLQGEGQGGWACQGGGWEELATPSLLPDVGTARCAVGRSKRPAQPRRTDSASPRMEAGASRGRARAGADRCGPSAEPRKLTHKDPAGGRADRRPLLCRAECFSNVSTVSTQPF